MEKSPLGSRIPRERSSPCRSLRAQGNYLDVSITKVKPEKAFEAETISKKIADANRRNDGDRALVEQPLYGAPYTYIFITQRHSYANVDKGNDDFFIPSLKTSARKARKKSCVAGRTVLSPHTASCVSDVPTSAAKCLRTQNLLPSTIPTSGGLRP